MSSSSRSARAIFAFGALIIAPPVLMHAQTKAIPIRTVDSPVVSTEHFKRQPNVRGMSSGLLLVNDQAKRRLIVFDSAMQTFSVSADSESTNGVLYPGSGVVNTLIPFTADSTLLIDPVARTFLVIDQTGRIVHAMAHPKSQDLRMTSIPYPGNPGGDGHGGLIYRAMSDGRPDPKPGDPPITATRDTIGLVRVDFNTRTVDTIASYSLPRNSTTITTTGPKGKRVGTRLVNPVPGVPDEWVVLTDGTLAIVRQHDYHVDFLSPSGEKYSSPKLSFDWRRFTDEDKLARIDSMKRVIDSVNNAGPMKYGWLIMYNRTPEGGAAPPDTVFPTVSFTPISEIPDYFPPIRQGSSKPDEDGNLWILPMTSSQAGGGLLYDVVNRKGELFQRVRIPPDYVIVGHGRGNVVYLAKNDKSDNSWVLARTRISPAVIK